MSELPYRLKGPLVDVADGESVLARLRAAAGDLRLQFIVLVIVPTLLAGVYYGLIASKRYVSHAEYVVRGVNVQHSIGGLAAILNTFGVSPAGDDVSAIEEFVKSRDAVRQLDQRIDLRQVYGNPDADFLSRFPRFWEKNTFESLYYVVQDYVSITQEQHSGVTTLEVQAFRPEDAKRIADELLALAEEMANRMNERAQGDTLREAQKQVDRARDAIIASEAALVKFRNTELLVDPNASATLLLGAINDLASDASRVQTQVKTTQALSPSNPGLTSMQAQIAALDAKIAEERKGLAGNDTALADKVSTYERLTLNRDLADKGYGAALLTLQSAQQEAERQQIYIEPMVYANLPDLDTEPRRIRRVATYFVLGFMVFAMLWILAVGAKDHAQ